MNNITTKNYNNLTSLLVELNSITDPRGRLIAGQYPAEISFIPNRFFVISGVPSEAIRGEHAHKKCHQFLIPLQGSCTVILDNALERVSFELSRPNQGLYIPPMTWGSQFEYTEDCILLVLASDQYDANDYIRSYDQFLITRKSTALGGQLIA